MPHAHLYYLPAHYNFTLTLLSSSYSLHIAYNRMRSCYKHTMSTLYLLAHVHQPLHSHPSTPHGRPKDRALAQCLSAFLASTAPSAALCICSNCCLQQRLGSLLSQCVLHRKVPCHSLNPSALSTAHETTADRSSTTVEAASATPLPASMCFATQPYSAFSKGKADTPLHGAVQRYIAARACTPLHSAFRALHGEDEAGTLLQEVSCQRQGRGQPRQPERAATAEKKP